MEHPFGVCSLFYLTPVLHLGEKGGPFALKQLVVDIAHDPLLEVERVDGLADGGPH